MRRFFASVSLMAVLGCADDSGGPRVATDAAPPAATAPTAPSGPAKPADKGAAAPSAAPNVGGTAPLQP